MPNTRCLHIESLENRALLAASSFEPPSLEVGPNNNQQHIRVLVLNYEPTVPSEDNKTLWEVFPHWNDPRELASAYTEDMERASGGAVDYEIIEWRDLNEFPIFRNGFRYDPDDFVQRRRGNVDLIESDVDFHAVAEQQGLAELINSDVIDEVWGFGDHYFLLNGEAWMAGPEAFFINGRTFPDFDVEKAFAGFGFNYERGVAEMLHNNSHRTENHMKRAYNGVWNLENPVTPWDLFTANVGQTSRDAFGIGSGHYPFNGTTDYDYANRQTVMSYADEFVENFPNQTYATVPSTRDAWGDRGKGDWQRGYMEWFFGHLPRAAGEGPDGRQNNWYEYIYDFNAYRPNTGLPRDNEAILNAASLTASGQTHYEFNLRFYDLEGIDTTTLGNEDLFVTGPNGFNHFAQVVEIGSRDETTIGEAQTVKYRVSAPNGSWQSSDAGNYQIQLEPSAISDSAGNELPPSSLGSFQVIPGTDARIDVNALLLDGTASVSATPWDVGAPADIFDGNSQSLYRSRSANPAIVTLEFTSPQSLSGFEALFSHAGGNNAYRWQVETADSRDDLDSKTGTYRLAVASTESPSDVVSSVDVGGNLTARLAKLTVHRQTGDDHVHINEWVLLGDSMPDSELPTASLVSVDSIHPEDHTTKFVIQLSDDRAIDIRTINYGDILVTGPNEYAQFAAIYGLDLNANGPSRNATFFVSAPNNVWQDSPPGTYTITLLADEVFDTSGKPILPSVLGEFQVGIAGDLTGDGFIDANDLDLLCTAINGVVVSGADLNQDDLVTYDDVEFLLTNMLRSVPGDADLNRRVDSNDLNQLGVHWLQLGDVGWATGDFTCDGAVNALDLNELGINWQFGVVEAVRIPRAPLNIRAHLDVFLKTDHDEDPLFLSTRLTNTVEVHDGTAKQKHDSLARNTFSERFELRRRQAIIRRTPDRNHVPRSDFDSKTMSARTVEELFAQLDDFAW